MSTNRSYGAGAHQPDRPHTSCTAGQKNYCHGHQVCCSGRAGIEPKSNQSRRPGPGLLQVKCVPSSKNSLKLIEFATDIA